MREAWILFGGSLIVLAVFWYHILRCRHVWELVDKTELPSRLEEAKKGGKNISFLIDSQIERMSEKKVVLVIRCSKCGAVKIIREKN